MGVIVFGMRIGKGIVLVLFMWRVVCWGVCDVNRAITLK